MRVPGLPDSPSNMSLLWPILSKAITCPSRVAVIDDQRRYTYGRLIAGSLIEIVRSCYNVSLLILFAKRDQLNSQFITIPLDLRDPYGLAVLSCIVNSTPGTVWVEILPESQDLALHVFDLHNAQWWIDTIKTRYERPLIEIFE